MSSPSWALRSTVPGRSNSCAWLCNRINLTGPKTKQKPRRSQRGAYLRTIWRVGAILLDLLQVNLGNHWPIKVVVVLLGWCDDQDLSGLLKIYYIPDILLVSVNCRGRWAPVTRFLSTESTLGQEEVPRRIGVFFPPRRLPVTTCYPEVPHNPGIFPPH